MRLALPVLLFLLEIAQAQPPFSAAAALDSEITQAIHDGLLPGAVLLIGHDGQVVYRKAYGSRALLPHPEPMTPDTIFDAASLTKVVATTSSLMKLFEVGKFRLNDPVTKYLPEFQNGQSDTTIRNLLTHFSGLRPDLDLKSEWSGYETGIRKAFAEKSVTPPGTRFVYSDINFILLGELVHRLSGQLVSDYSREKIFQPLGMKDSRFLPQRSLLSRIAPTEIDEKTGQPLRGVVHDDTTRFMGGVAGHAGLFTTADDLSRFARMLIGLGTLDGTRVFSPLTVRKFTSPQSPADQPILRGLGWDMDSPFSTNRGELFPIGSYGHTGFTGTSLWIDPTSRSYVILLANSVHPHRGKSLVGLRARVATMAAAGLGIDAPGFGLTGYNETITGAGVHRTVNRNAQTLTGLDVLREQQFAPLKGKRIGLITNHTGVARDGKRNIDLMAAAGLNLRALFSPEHGLAGREDRTDIGNSTDAASGLPVYSLYQSANKRIPPERLRELDVLVFDIQDIGARFYTYSCTMLYALEDSARQKIPLYVLDRPNPITGVHVEGPVLDPELQSFVGCYDMPLRHGLTFGELAAMANTERRLGADLHVIPIKNWQRGDWWDATDLPWTDPSPNMRSLNAALLYPGVAMLEAGKNYSVGRGTDAPFEQIGADWIDGKQLAFYLNQRYIPGIRVYPTRFRPSASNFSGREIEGIRFILTQRDAFDSTRFGLELAAALEKIYPGKITWEADRFLIGSRSVMDSLRKGEDPGAIVQKMEDSVQNFVARRKSYLLYR